MENITIEFFEAINHTEKETELRAELKDGKMIVTIDGNSFDGSEEYEDMTDEIEAVKQLSVWVCDNINDGESYVTYVDGKDF